MKLRIDNREPDKLKSLFGDGEGKSYSIEYTNLAAGDFEFIQTSDGNSQIVLLIERKDVDDLSSSLTDGRFDQQKTKLSLASSAQTDNPFPIAYLIEGEYRGHKKQSAIESVMLTTPFRDGFFVLQTASIQETYEMVERIIDLYERDKMKPLTEDELHRRFISSRAALRGGGSFSKKDNWWVISLGQVPGIGPAAAKAIANVYPSAKSLILAYEANTEVGPMLLKDIKGGTRKIGPKASQAVWDALSPDQDKAQTLDSFVTTTPKKTVTKKVVKAVTKKPIKAKPTNDCLFNDD